MGVVEGMCFRGRRGSLRWLWAQVSIVVLSCLLKWFCQGRRWKTVPSDGGGLPLFRVVVTDGVDALLRSKLMYYAWLCGGKICAYLAVLAMCYIDPQLTALL